MEDFTEKPKLTDGHGKPGSFRLTRVEWSGCERFMLFSPDAALVGTFTTKDAAVRRCRDMGVGFFDSECFPPELDSVPRELKSPYTVAIV